MCANIMTASTSVRFNSPKPNAAWLLIFPLGVLAGMSAIRPSCVVRSYEIRRRCRLLGMRYKRKPRLRCHANISSNTGGRDAGRTAPDRTDDKKREHPRVTRSFHIQRPWFVNRAAVRKFLIVARPFRPPRHSCGVADYPVTGPEPGWFRTIMGSDVFR